jgi:hypothetical protein
MERQLEIGTVVTYVDARYQAHEALVTAIHGNPRGANSVTKTDESGKYVTDEHGYLVSEDIPGTEGSNWPCINLVCVSSDEAKQDQYGRQIERETSVVHIRNNSAGGFCWQWPDEEHHVVVKTIS